MKPPPDPHYRHRFSAEIIAHAVWLYHVFSLSLRDVELLLAERGIIVSWCQKFGQSFAGRLRRSRPRRGDKWYMDEVFIPREGRANLLRPSGGGGMHGDNQDGWRIASSRNAPRV